MVTSGTGHDRCPSRWRDPDGIPIAVLATPKKFGSPEIVSRPGGKFFLRGIAMVNAGLPNGARDLRGAACSDNPRPRHGSPFARFR
jgi:hypothetical protein